MKILFRLTVFLLFCEGIYGQATIHVLNPWRNDTCAWHRDSLRMGGNNYVGYYPGSGLTPEGGGWFYYTYPETNISFTFTNWCGPEDWAGRVDYGVQFRLDSLLAEYPEGTKEIWITIPDSVSDPVISDQPPLGSKFIYFLTPWDIGAPRIVLQGYGSPKMRMDTSITRCGWFKFPYFGSIDSAQVKFMNSLDSSIYSSVGIGDGGFIDLSAALQVSDTAWVLSVPYPDGTPAVHTEYPGQSAPCERTLLLATIMRDWDTTHPDVAIGETKRGCGADSSYNSIIPGMVGPELDENGKPVVGNSTCPIDNFNWFTTEMVTDDYDNAMCYNLELTKNEDGLFEYDTNFFFPADSFRYLDEEQTVPNPRYGGGQDDNGNPHNYYFTLELWAEFEYRKGQTFYFRGDDDVWVFINNRLVVDIGGVHNPQEGAVNLDTLGLTVGNTYSFKGFFTERNCCGSNFRIVTSINLRTSSSLFITVTELSSTTKQFDMFEKVSKNNLSCDPGETVVDTQKAIVEFFIEGRPFPPDPPRELPIGTSFGGITIVDNSTVIIDSTAITGLPPGDYLIRYYLSHDHSQGGTIPFTVTSAPPDHLDILVDTIPIDQENDAVVDSIVIGMLETSTEAYAVIRDVDQRYLSHATEPVWTVGDTTVVRVDRLPIASRCKLTKVNEGQTWLVVNHAPGLTPDSVLVITHMQPPYPIIVSGVIRDNDANLVPDMLHLTLSDTFESDQMLDSIQIAYREAVISIPAQNVIIQGTELDVPLEDWVIDGRPKGTATIFMTVGGENKSSTREVTDGVSPAIIAADVLENEEGEEADVLFLTFSEPVIPGSIIGRQLLLIKEVTSDTSGLTVGQILAQANDSTFTVQVQSGVHAVAGDRLRLVPESAGGTLSDLSGNMPHDLNRSVVIGFRPGAASIAAAWYFDANADGIIDEVLVRFRRNVELSEIETISILHGKGKFRYPSSQCTQLSDSLFRIDVGDSIELLSIIRHPKLDTLLSTDGALFVSVEYIAFPGILRSSTAADSAAPVINSATLEPGPFLESEEGTEEGTRENDTLEVIFSEDVLQFGESPFLLSTQKDGQRYSFTLEYLGTGDTVHSYRFRVISISNVAVEFASAGDTIWIDPSAGVHDSGGVIQTNPLNRRVLLQVDWPEADWNVRISPNPFSRTTQISGPVFGTGVGTAILLTPTAPADQARARVIIYDPVGNVVKKPDTEPFNSGFRALWDGTNRKGRYVGAGTYIAVIRIDDGTPQTLTEKIGFSNR